MGVLSPWVRDAAVPAQRARVAAGALHLCAYAGGVFARVVAGAVSGGPLAAADDAAAGPYRLPVRGCAHRLPAGPGAPLARVHLGGAFASRRARPDDHLRCAAALRCLRGHLRRVGQPFGGALGARRRAVLRGQHRGLGDRHRGVHADRLRDAPIHCRFHHRLGPARCARLLGRGRCARCGRTVAALLARRQRSRSWAHVGPRGARLRQRGQGELSGHDHLLRAGRGGGNQQPWADLLGQPGAHGLSSSRAATARTSATAIG